MAASTIDTLEIAQELRRAGVPEPHAEAIAHVFKRRYDADRDEMVTRGYLDASQAKLAAEPRADLADLRTDIARLERDLLLKLTGIVTAAVAIVGALGMLF